MVTGMHLFQGSERFLPPTPEGRKAFGTNSSNSTTTAVDHKHARNKTQIETLQYEQERFGYTWLRWRDQALWGVVRQGDVGITAFLNENVGVATLCHRHAQPMVSLCTDGPPEGLRLQCFMRVICLALGSCRVLAEVESCCSG